MKCRSDFSDSFKERIGAFFVANMKRDFDANACFEAVHNRLIKQGEESYELGSTFTKSGLTETLTWHTDDDFVWVEVPEDGDDTDE